MGSSPGQRLAIVAGIVSRSCANNNSSPPHDTRKKEESRVAMITTMPRAQDMNNHDSGNACNASGQRVLEHLVVIVVEVLATATIGMLAVETNATTSQRSLRVVGVVAVIDNTNRPATANASSNSRNARKGNSTHSKK